MLSMSILRMHFCLFFFLDQQLHVFHVCRHQNKRCSRSKCLTRLLAIAFNIFETDLKCLGVFHLATNTWKNYFVEKLVGARVQEIFDLSS